VRCEKGSHASQVIALGLGSQLHGHISVEGFLCWEWMVLAGFPVGSSRSRALVVFDRISFVFPCWRLNLTARVQVDRIEGCCTATSAHLYVVEVRVPEFGRPGAHWCRWEQSHGCLCRGQVTVLRFCG
jgi:hypothetical protein